MEKVFKIPPVGSQVTVTTFHALKGYPPHTQRTFVKSGTILKNEKHDDVRSFRLHTGNPAYPVSLIAIENVVDIKFADGKRAEKETRPVLTIKEWKVKSDSRKGGHYIVTFENGHYNCNCLGFMYRKHCRHINKVKEAA